MNKKPFHFDFRFVIVLVLTGAIVALDQWTKSLAAARAARTTHDLVFGKLLSITYSENPGAFNGWFADHPWVFLVASTVGIVAIFTYLLVWQPKRNLAYFALGAIAAGGIGNMIDRTLVGYVVDFIHFPFLDIQTKNGVFNIFNNFNVADSFVTVGAVALMIELVLEYRDEVRAERAKKNGDA